MLCNVNISLFSGNIWDTISWCNEKSTMSSIYYCIMILSIDILKIIFYKIKRDSIVSNNFQWEKHSQCGRSKFGFDVFPMKEQNIGPKKFQVGDHQSWTDNHFKIRGKSSFIYRFTLWVSVFILHIFW